MMNCIESEEVEVKYEPALEGECPITVEYGSTCKPYGIKDDIEDEMAKTCSEYFRAHSTSTVESSAYAGKHNVVSNSDNDCWSDDNSRSHGSSPAEFQTQLNSSCVIQVETDVNPRAYSCFIQEEPESHLNDQQVNQSESNSCPSLPPVQSSLNLNNNDAQSQSVAKPYQCKICGRPFGRRQYLTAHIKTHTDDKPHQCELCYKRFTKKSYLTQHMKLHTKDKIYQCHLCDKKFSHKSYLNGHIKTHSPKKSFKCEVCDRYFARKSHLTVHERTHTKEKPYQCILCSKTYSHISTLTIHIRTHTQEKPFQCEVCQKRFSCKSNFNDHLKIHTNDRPYQCEMCDKSFCRKAHLVIHTRTHTKEKPYQCDVCFKQFSLKSTLPAHMRTHTNEKPFQCYLCEKQFTKKSYLNKHLKTIHSVNNTIFNNLQIIDEQAALNSSQEALIIS